MNIGSTMTNNVPEADQEYVEVAVKYEGHRCSEAFTNFSVFGSYPRKPRA
jgi:hypothetical protein